MEICFKAFGKSKLVNPTRRVWARVLHWHGGEKAETEPGNEFFQCTAKCKASGNEHTILSTKRHPQPFM